METVSQAGRYGNSFAGRQVWKQFRRQAGMETVSQAGRRPEIVQQASMQNVLQAGKQTETVPQAGRQVCN